MLGVIALLNLQKVVHIRSERKAGYKSDHQVEAQQLALNDVAEVLVPEG